MVSLLERFRSQKKGEALTELTLEDEAMVLALAGRPLSAEQLACVNEESLALAERRGKERDRLLDGVTAGKDLPAAREVVAKHRDALQAAIRDANAKYAPKILEAERAAQGLAERESRGQVAENWLRSAAPAHASAPLLDLRKRLTREEQYLENNLRSLNQAKARLQAAKDGTLPYTGAFPVSSGHRGAAGDKATQCQVNKNFSGGVVESLKEERRRLQVIFDESKARVDDLRSKVARLDALQLEAWPLHGAVAEILGQPWDAAEAAKVQAPGLICTTYGTPAAVPIS